MASEGKTDPHSSTLLTGAVERGAPRFTLEWPSLYSMNDGPEWEGTVINLSRDGCAIRKTAHVQRGDILQISIFPSPNQSPIEIALAVVRWSTTVQFGVEFMMLSPRHTKRLCDHLALLEEAS